MGMFESVEPLEKILLSICFVVLIFAVIWGTFFPSWVPFGGDSGSVASVPEPSFEPTATVTPAATPTPEKDPEPTRQAIGWQYVQTYTGSGMKKTALFSIQGSEWRMKATCESSIPDYAGFQVLTHEQATDDVVDTWILSVKEGGGTQNVYEGPGTYYLEVVGANVDSWTVRIEENL